MADSTSDGLFGLPTATWGALLGGPRDEQMEPIIGHQAIVDAQRGAVLRAGLALMANSGPQTYRHSLGQDIAGAISSGQDAYSGQLDNSLKGAMTAQQLRMSQFQMARQMALLQAAQGILGGGDQQSPQPSAGSPLPMGSGTPPQGSAVGPSAAPSGGPGMPSVPNFARQTGPAVPPGAAAPSGGVMPPAAAATASAALNQSDRQRKGLAAMSLLDPEHATGYNTAYGLLNPELQTLPDGTVVNMRDPSLLGTNHAALDPGMIRDASGAVSNAPGYIQSSYSREAAKAAAEHSQDLVSVVVPGQGTVQMPRSQAFGSGIGIGVGPNGQPQVQLGGQGAVMTAEDPAALAERQGNVKSFLSAKDDAQTKASAAAQTLPLLDNIDSLVRQAKPGLGAGAWVETARVLDQAGLLDPKQQDRLAAAKQFVQQQNSQLLSGLKQQFGGARISNMDLKAAESTLGKLDDPQQAVLYANDVKRFQAHKAQAYSDFMQNYTGSRGQFEQAWRNSPEAKASLYDDPVMWKHLPVQQGRAGTPVAGRSFIRTPGGAIHEVQLDQYGEPAPLGQQ